MKEIKLNRIVKSSKHYTEYSVVYGNGNKRTFPSSREASYFWANTNKFLTEKLHDLFQNYTDVLNSYNESWFYFENKLKKNQADKLIAEFVIEETLNETKKRFNLIIQKCSTSNGNHLVFEEFNNIIANLEKVISILSDFWGQKSSTIGKYNMDVYLRRLLNTKKELQEWGKLPLSNSIPTHISDDNVKV